MKINLVSGAYHYFLALSELLDKMAAKNFNVSPDAWKHIRNDYTIPAREIRRTTIAMRTDPTLGYSSDLIAKMNSTYDRFLNRKNQKLSEAEHMKLFAGWIIEKLIKDYPIVVVDNVSEPLKEVSVMERYFKNSLSIADKIAKVAALDFDHPSTIDWKDLFYNQIIDYTKNGFPGLLVDSLFDDKYCLLSYDEFKQAIDFDAKLMVAWTENLVSTGLIVAKDIE